MLNQTISHFKILDQLGRGGMGIVYKAQDLRLDRLVALKFLSAQSLGSAQARQRFIQEARVASGLDHPNICTIFEIDEIDDDQMFIAMAYYQGDTLDRLIKQGPMVWDQLIDLFGQITHGLEAAHQAGLMHRDIKPANIIVTTNGRAKILDFGLARPVGESELTRAGTTLGTVAYMSPEQARGRPVDQRTDIWSLGVVLYELITGKRPFQGPDMPSTLLAITTAEVPPLNQHRLDVPPVLLNIVQRALMKDPGNRYQNAAAIIADLEKVQQEFSDYEMPQITRTLEQTPPPLHATSTVREPSILVLPFADLSPNKDNEYFSDGLTDEIIGDLSQIGGLRVISRTSSMLLKDAKKDVKTIGNELKVNHVLEGSVRKSGSNIRITVQLIDAINDRMVWTNRFSGTLEDIFKIQEQVAQAIVQALKLQLTPQEQEKINRRPIDNLHAYECYLRARQEIFTWTEESLDRALQHLQNGLKIVGENALLYAGLGYTHWAYVNAGIKPEEHLEQVEFYTQKVIAMEPESALGYFLRGVTEQVITGDVQKSVNSLKRALILDINNPDILFYLCLAYSCAGKIEAARPLADRLLLIDPLNPLNQGLPGYLLTLEGRFHEAVLPSKTMYEMDTGNPAGRFIYGHALAFDRQTEKACLILDQLESDSPEHPFGWMGAFLKYALLGDRDNALKSATSELKQMAKVDLQYSWFVAQRYALIDEEEEAVNWMENAVDRGFINYPLFTQFDPFLKSLQGNSRFQQLMQNVKEQWECFEV